MSLRKHKRALRIWWLRHRHYRPNRKHFLVLLALLCGFGLYSAAWWYQAERLRVFIGEALTDSSLLVTDSSINISYRKISIRGFPFDMEWRIQKPLITWQKSGKKIILQSSYPLSIQTSLLARKWRIELPQTIRISNSETASFSRLWLVEYDKPAYFSFALSRPNLEKLWHWWFSSVPDSISAYHSLVSDFGYQDEGGRLIDDDSRRLKGQWQAINSSLNFSETAGDTTLWDHHIKLEMNALNLDFIADPTLIDPPGAMRIIADFNLAIPQSNSASGIPEAHFKLNEILLQAARFTLSGMGEIHVETDDVFPRGELSLALSDIPAFLDWSISWPKDPAKIDPANFLPHPLTRNAWEQFLNWLAKQNPAEDNDENEAHSIGITETGTPINIVIKREKQDDVFINKIPLPEIFTEYRRMLAQPASKPKKAPPASSTLEEQP
jgi:hypothetical protein